MYLIDALIQQIIIKMPWVWIILSKGRGLLVTQPVYIKMPQCMSMARSLYLKGTKSTIVFI